MQPGPLPVHEAKGGEPALGQPSPGRRLYTEVLSALTTGPLGKKQYSHPADQKTGPQRFLTKQGVAELGSGPRLHLQRPYFALLRFTGGPWAWAHTPAYPGWSVFQVRLEDTVIFVGHSAQDRGPKRPSFPWCSNHSTRAPYRWAFLQGHFALG